MAASKYPSIYQDFIPLALHNAVTKPKIRIDYIERGEETEYTYTLIWRGDGKTNTTILNPCKAISICDENNQKRPMILEMKKKKSRKNKKSGSRKHLEKKKAQFIEESKEVLKTATMNETQPINSHISYPSSTVTLSTASQPLSRPSLPTDNKKIPAYHISKDQSGASNRSYACSIKSTKSRPKKKKSKKKKCSSKNQKKSTAKSKKKIPSRVLLKLKIIKDIINQPVFEAHYNYRTILHDAIDETLKRNNEPRLLLKTYRVGQLVLYGSDRQRPLNYEEYFCRSVGELREKDGIVYITVNLDK